MQAPPHRRPLSYSFTFSDQLHRREEEDRPDGLVQQTYDGRPRGVSAAPRHQHQPSVFSVFSHHILIHNEVLSLYNEVAKLKTYSTIERTQYSSRWG